jgi:acyl-CoA synthetase (AMP-forming)/AMP-acid ligase II
MNMISPQFIREFLTKNFSDIGRLSANDREFIMESPFIRNDYKKHCSVNVDSGLWQCFKTGRNGNFVSLYSHLQGIPYFRAQKELIIKNGFNVYPPEVEAALLRLPEIIQAAVIGQAVPGNERIIAFVQTSASKLDLGRINQQLRSTLAGYKLLDEIRVVDQLPAAPSGKILKHRLADLL